MVPPQLEALASRLGVALPDSQLLGQAFVHSSYFNENSASVLGHNERLEFLGDAVIGLVVSRLLYERFPEEDEGFLTARRAALVNRDALARMALELELDRHLLLGRGESVAGGARRPSLLAATFEAVAGAIFLTVGLEATMTTFRRLFDPLIDVPGGDTPLKSAKSRLQEWTQAQLRSKPRYELLETTGPPHDQIFTVAVAVGGRRVATGTGSSRHRAEEEAAERALAQVDGDVGTPDSAS
jgi:ribonuclease III